MRGILTALVFLNTVVAAAGETERWCVAVGPVSKDQESAVVRAVQGLILSTLARDGFATLDMTTDPEKSPPNQFKWPDAILTFNLLPVRSGKAQTAACMLTGIDPREARRIAGAEAVSRTGGDLLAAAKEACGEALAKVIDQIKGLEAREARDGRRYEVALENPPRKVPRHLQLALEKCCDPVDAQPAGRGRFRIQATCKHTGAELEAMVADALRSGFPDQVFTSRLVDRRVEIVFSPQGSDPAIPGAKAP